MLKTMVLICSLSTPHEDCSEANAVDVVRMAPAKNAMMCGLFGQAGIAPTAIAPGRDQYLKIVCEHVREAAR